MVFLLENTVENVRVIEQNWLDYQADRSEKARLESVLSTSIGYGGMVHEFKNYVLRHDEKHMDAVQAHIGAARVIIKQYFSLGTTEAEKIALEDLSLTLDKYVKALFTARSLIQKNISPEKID
ncbi:MAG: hypothetical protein D3924_17690 [Candidatus Electrothrix sp. AR4]|nr:hypothetical protein [Candidatus Electrothrix sp. AR4]